LYLFRRHTSAPTNGPKFENRHRPAPQEHRLESLCDKGPSKVFRIVNDRTASNTKLCHGIDSCCTGTPSSPSGQ